MTEIIFPDGITFDKVEIEKAPWIKGKIAVNPERLLQFAKEGNYLSPRGFIFLDLKKSSKGNLYLSVNTWKPAKPETVDENTAKQIKDLRDNYNSSKEEDDFSSIPF